MVDAHLPLYPRGELLVERALLALESGVAPPARERHRWLAGDHRASRLLVPPVVIPMLHLASLHGNRLPVQGGNQGRCRVQTEARVKWLRRTAPSQRT